VDSANPTLRQRELGMRLRELRTSHRLTVEDVATELLCSATKISRLETGARRASLRDVRDLVRIYEVTDKAEADYLMSLAKQAREPAWWTRYDDLNLSPFIGLEQEAVGITSFCMYYVPPLVQTPNYAKAIIKGITPRMAPRIAEQRLEARMRRKELLDAASPPRYRTILDEAVLHRQVGGAKVMLEQLDNILTCANQAKVTVQVLPFELGEYGSIDSNFDFLEFAQDSPQGPVVFVESLCSNYYLERPAEVARYREAVEYLRDAALSPRESLSVIADIRTKYTDRLNEVSGNAANLEALHRRTADR
jgi:transcriptional regulator with XRE-family HTH domain